jgi:ketosteroid isomerase-like protein
MSRKTRYLYWEWDEMTVEDNKSIAVAVIEELGRLNIPMELFADDAVWRIPGQGDIKLEKFQHSLRRLYEMYFAEPGNMIIHGVTAEGDRVAVESESFITLRGGKTYNNTYHWLLILEDGKVKCIREHTNTAYAREMFGIDFSPQI